MFTCLEEFGPHVDHEGCASMLSQMIADEDLLGKRDDGVVTVTEGCWVCFYRPNHCEVHDPNFYEVEGWK